MKKKFPAAASVNGIMPSVNKIMSSVKENASSVNTRRVFLTAVLFAIICALSLTSCATVQKIPGLEKIYVTNTKQVNLLPNECLSRELDDLIQLNVETNDMTFSVLLYVQADKDEIFIEVMNDFMMTMGFLFYKENTIGFDCPAFPPSLKPEYIIYDLQNVFYSAESLSKNFAASKISFEENMEGSTVKRTIKDGLKLIEEIKFSEEDGIVIKNYLRKYQYTLYPAE